MKSYRQQLAKLGIEDDAQEAAIIAILEAKDLEIELGKLRVADEVWRLEDELLEERAR